jgi:RHS repeat-associated protein
VDDSANVVNEQSHGRYDPWGQPWSADGSKNELKEGSRGFTGHENIASAGLIHMNGRVYDPRIAQFLGPDPAVMGSIQSLNRYSYARHSPFLWVDLNGYSLEPHSSLLNHQIMRFGNNNEVFWKNFHFRKPARAADGTTRYELDAQGFGKK